MFKLNYNKSLGIGFAILAIILLIQNTLYILLQGSSSPSEYFWQMRGYYNQSVRSLVPFLVQTGAVLFIAFLPSNKTSIWAKVGAILFIASIGWICCGAHEEHLAIAEIIRGLGILLLVWGCTKLWMPLKISYSVIGAIVIANCVIGCIILTTGSNPSAMETLLAVDLNLSVLEFFAILVTFVLSIVCVFKRDKSDSDAPQS